MIARTRPEAFQPSRLLPRRGRSAAFLQLIAFLLILASPLAPAMLRVFDTHLDDSNCRGDHRLCGCSPARVANNTCCCAHPSTPSCCVVSGLQKDNDHAAAEEDRLTCVIRALPCGDGEPATLAAGDPWLPAPSGPALPVEAGGGAYLITASTAKPSPVLQPDVPPPQHSLLF